MKKYYCIDCKKEVSDYRHKRCLKCSGIIRQGTKRPDVIVYNKITNKKGSNNGNFKNWSSKRRNKCADCGKMLGTCSVYLGIKKCRNCMMKERWSNLDYKVKVITKTMKSCNIQPNKKENLLAALINKFNYRYVGNGQFFIKGFNPDFVNLKEKKIIEMFGDYWHKDTQIRDKNRIKEFKKLGYKTLIIWEHELKNLDKVVNKIAKFI